MRVSVVSEQVFSKTPDGAYWSTGASESFWKRYLEVFDHLRIVARVENTASPPEGAQTFDNRVIAFADVPFYRGPRQVLAILPQIRAALKAAYDANDAWILRVPSTLANFLTPTLSRARHPYAVEVVGDPQDVFAPQGISHFFRPVFRRWYSSYQVKQCCNAKAVAYVTKSRLQGRYPASSTAYTTHYSSLDLPDEAYADQPKPPENFAHRPLRLVTVASLSQLYKAPHILIDAVSSCLAQGHDLRLEIVGDGIYSERLQRQVRELRIQDRVRFTGQLPSGAAVWRRLDESDLFVLPSMTEGLPRAMIEAMARGLPCVGSTAGGMPELLPAEYLVRPGCRESLATKIAEICSTPTQMSTMSAENLRHAQEYRADLLRTRRNKLYRTLHETTLSWAGRLAA